ncbi:hypothetical protein HRW17_37620, partial [Streptomyces lunaelactis]|nr:hypothetical protein [Streptomyces lunaelactis]
INSGGETMTAFDNGFGDWNMPWKEWRDGSALKNKASSTTGAAEQQREPADAARLRPQV